MVQISNREEFERWLKQRNNREEAACLAARTALRAVPFAVADLRERPEKSPGALILPLIRANSISWGSAFVPPHEIAAAFAADAAAAAAAAARAAAADAAADAAAAAAAARAAAADAADADAAAFAADAAAAAFAADAAAFAADAAAFAIDVAYFWNALSADATALENGLAPAELAQQPLWPEAAPAPSIALENWQEMRDILFRREGEDWAVWTDWYQARLGGAPVNEKLEIARLLQDDLSIWDKGPKTVNAAIRKLIEEHTQAPAQRPNAGKFQENSRKIDVNDLADADQVADDDASRDLHREARDALAPLTGETAGRNNLLTMAGIPTRAAQILSALGSRPTEVSPHLLVLKSRQLENALRADEERAASNDSDIPPLDESARLSLRDAVDALKLYVSVDPYLRGFLASLRAQPPEPLDVDEAIALAQSAYDNDAATQAAKERVEEAAETQSESGANTLVNFIIIGAKIAGWSGAATIGVSAWLVTYEAKILATAGKYAPEIVPWLTRIIDTLKQLPIPGGPI